MTQLDATILTKEEFDQKTEELNKLLAAIEIYGNTEVAEAKSEAVQSLFDDLSKNLYALDCAFLDAKVQTYTKIVAMLKTEPKVVKR